jgi:DNA primase
MKGRIAIPIHNPGGELVAYAGRWPGDPLDGNPKYKFPKGFKKSLEVFNFHRAVQGPADLPLVIVEGFFDCIALREAGIYKCVALMGTSLSATQADLIASAVSDDGEIEILFDADEAGRHGAEIASQELSNRTRVRVIDLPEEGMQPDHLTPEELAIIFE